MSWRPVDRAELLRVSGNDPYLEYVAGPGATGVVGPQGWAVLHRWRPTGFHGGAAIVAADAPAEAESTALVALLEAAPEFPIEWFSVADGRDLTLPAGFASTGSGRWSFLSTDAVPPPVPVPEGLSVVTLDDAADAARLEEFGSGHNPDFEGFPGRGYSLLWRAVVDGAGQLLAIGALHELDTGLPHLSGLVVDGAHRGRGLGRLLTVDLTRASVERSGVCTLGVYTDNHPALGLYLALGYTVHRAFDSRDFVAA